MTIDLSGIIPTVKIYLDEGWSVNHFEKNGNHDYILYSPKGSAFKSYDLKRNYCPFCDEDNPDWEEGFCNHSNELLDEESNARNLLNLIELKPSLRRNFP